jgi:hypothetical protein
MIIFLICLAGLFTGYTAARVLLLLPQGINAVLHNHHEREHNRPVYVRSDDNPWRF